MFKRILIPLDGSPFAERALETAVGIVLTGLGLWRLLDFFWTRHQIHSHPNGEESHEHFHRHPAGAAGSQHDHSHAVGLIGVLHGAAGTARFLVLIPIALIGSLAGSLAYVLFFSLGVTASMMAYAVCLGRIVEKSQGRFSFLQSVYQPLTALASLCIGVYWIWG